MKFKNKSIYYLKNNPYRLVTKILSKVMEKTVIRYLVSDKFYLLCCYKWATGKKLCIKSPVSFNEKLQWLKLHDRNPLYTQLVDKYEVQKYITKIIGKKYLIPLLGVYNKFEEINFSKLPNQFVIKCTHDSGGLVICKDKSKLDIKKMKNKINKCLKNNYYYAGREWPYKNVKPRIICEQFLINDTGEELKDYRFFCFNGEPRFVAVDFNITDKTKTRRNLYDLDWNLMDEQLSYPRELSKIVKKPNKFAEMIELSRKLSNGIPHVRVDFYYINGKIYFGEMTFYHQSGYGKFYPDEFDNKVGNWIDLSKQSFSKN